jgi:hypothetical protein
VGSSGWTGRSTAAPLANGSSDWFAASSSACRRPFGTAAFVSSAANVDRTVSPKSCWARNNCARTNGEVRKLRKPRGFSGGLKSASVGDRSPEIAPSGSLPFAPSITRLLRSITTGLKVRRSGGTRSSAAGAISLQHQRVVTRDRERHGYRYSASYPSIRCRTRNQDG